MITTVFNVVGWIYVKMDSFRVDPKTLMAARRAACDHVVTSDARALLHLTAMEKICRVSPYFGSVQTDIQPYMRRILTEWMFQVCQSVRTDSTLHVADFKYNRCVSYRCVRSSSVRRRCSRRRCVTWTVT